MAEISWKFIEEFCSSRIGTRILLVQTSHLPGLAWVTALSIMRMYQVCFNFVRYIYESSENSRHWHINQCSHLSSTFTVKIPMECNIVPDDLFQRRECISPAVYILFSYLTLSAFQHRLPRSMLHCC